MSKHVVVLSGGMDSVTALYRSANLGHEVIPVSFNYGQKHKKELYYAEYHAARLHAEGLGTSLKVINLSSLTPHIATSALTSDLPVPEGHYAAENMKQTVVPNRNMIMLSIASGIAVAEKAEAVVTGIHAGDHAIYPDCRPEFRHSLEETVHLGNEGFVVPSFKVVAPFVNIGKHDIVRIGDALRVPYNMTWSCYKGGDLHCGKCGTCVERIEAFQLAGVEDPTIYEDAPVDV
jgi:7-cyano-7-deazaguanine synthase